MKEKYEQFRESLLDLGIKPTSLLFGGLLVIGAMASIPSIQKHQARIDLIRDDIKAREAKAEALDRQLQYEQRQAEVANKRYKSCLPVVGNEYRNGTHYFTGLKEGDKPKDRITGKVLPTGTVICDAHGTTAVIDFGVELLGGIAAAWCVKSAWDASKNIGKRLRLVRDCGCNAFLLSEDEFRTYVKQFGDETVYQELTFAKDAGAELSPFAESWLRTCNKQLAGSNSEQLALTQSVAQSVQQPVAVPSLPSNVPPTTTQVDVWNPNADNEVDIVGEMTNQIGNYFVVGIGGSGKGMLLANALREVKRKHPGKKIFLVNGKVDPKEAGYFDGIVNVEKPLHCESAKPQTVAAWFDAAMEDFDNFAAQNNGALLVIDEGTIIGARLKTAKCTTLTDKLIGITSCGGSSGKNVWFVAQTPFVGANGSDTSGISQLTPIVLVNQTNLSVVDSWKRASLFKKFDTEEISELVNQSECNRAVYFGKNAQWYAMNKLTNYSAFDRDKGEYIGDNQTTNVRNQDTVIQQLEQQFNKVDERLTDCIYFDKLSDANEPVSFEAIRNHVKRNLPEFGKVNLIQDAIDKLIEQELITGDRETGYSIT